MNRLDIALFVNAQLMKLYLAAQDGELEVGEILPIVNDSLAFAGVDIPQFVGDVFIESDGDLHIILSKELLDKLKIRLK